MNPKYCKNILAKIGTVCAKQQLFSPGDRILVALSGGKDSLILLESLAERRSRLPFVIEVEAIHINISNVGYKTDIEYLREFCKHLDVPFHLRDFEIEIVDDSRKAMCFVCSRQRRKSLFEALVELKFNKLAFGHHMDDVLETLLMNMLYHGMVSAMPYSLRMFEGKAEVIRPLLELSNSELLEFAEIRGYKKELKKCPHENTNRHETAKLLSLIESKHKPAKRNMFRALNNIYPEYLPKYLK